jgi:hypothetical protein
LSLTQGLTSAQASTIITTAASSITQNIVAGLSTAVAQTYTGNALEALNTLAITEVGRLVEFSQGTLEGLMYIGRSGFNPFQPAALTFSDSNASFAQYENIDFRSTAENYYTRVTINPLTVASQTNNSGSAPYFKLELSTYDYNTTQANSLSQYYLNKFNSTDATVTGFASAYSQQTTVGQQSAFKNAIEFGNLIGSNATVQFRGTNYNVIIEGLTITADINSGNTNAEWYCSAQDLNNYLILDNTTFGKLDFNKLGF